jgi:broad specificity phosphatase PhoE
MKFILILVFTLSCILPSNAQDQSKSLTTTYYLIRHAEKDRSDPKDKNPNLNESGRNRADKWNLVFQNIDFDAVFSTEYNRTIQTAGPTAKKQKLEIQFYDPRQLYTEEFARSTQGKTVLVVGHSNTTPAFVNAILGEDKYKDMDDHDNGSLYIVTIMDGNKIDQVLKIN